MSAIITNKFRLHNAQLFKNQFSAISVEDNYYLFIGEPEPWESPYDDETPPAPVDSVELHKECWKTMLGLKRITEINVSYVIRRYSWEPNTVFAQYSDSDPFLFQHPTEDEVIAANLGSYNAGAIYCVTEDFKVYKCLSNNGGAVSTIEPSGTSVNSFDPGDGYIWKYMYTVSAPEILKFVTQDWIPVKTLTADDGSFQWQVQQAASPNALQSFLVTNQGSGYVDVADGDIDTATATTAVLATGGNLFDNSYNNSTIHIVAGLGAGQQRVISTWDSALQELTIADAWTTTPDNSSSYEIRPTVEILGDGTGALAKAVVSAGLVTSIQVTNAGTGYTTASATVTGGNIRLGGTTATVEPQLGPLTGHGADAVSELGGHVIMLNTQLAFNEGSGDFPTANEYRRLGIVFDPKDFGTSNSSTAVTLRATRQLQISGVTGIYQADEVISDGSANAKVVQAEDLGGGNFVVTFLQDETTGFDDFILSNVITGLTSGATGTLDSIDNPEVDPYSGDILYIEQRRPIARAIDMLEDIKIVIQF